MQFHNRKRKWEQDDSDNEDVTETMATVQCKLKKLVQSQQQKSTQLPVSKAEFQPPASDSQSLPILTDNISGTHTLNEYQVVREKIDKDIREKESVEEKSESVGKQFSSSTSLEALISTDKDLKKNLLRQPKGVQSLAHQIVKDKLLSKKHPQKKSSLTPPTQPSDHTHHDIGASQCHNVSALLLPVEVMSRHRLTVAEIKSLPQFRNYEPGIPSKVLYIKNIHSKVSEDDLMAVFGRYNCGNERIKIKLMKSGRMRGQAFIEFNTISTACDALQLANGFLMHDKPLVICFGRTATPL